jgi:bifunctional non-homologous end joining protein LigD
MDVHGMATISHPEKVLFPQEGLTKGDLAAYYAAIAPLMLPHLRQRPVTMERFPSGIGHKGFLQKDVSKGFPDWLERVEAPKRGGVVHYPLIEDRRALAWLANQNCITPHVWTRRVSDLRHPDVCVFDLDPAADDQPEVLRAAAIALRDLLEELGLASWVKTTGSKGFHIVVPLDGSADLPTAAHFADAVGTLLVRRDPAHLTQEFHKVDRDGRILVDTGRNTYSATFASAYAVRAKPGAPISAPCTWKEIERGDVHPRSFTLRSMERRIADVGDLWAEMLRRGQPLGSPIERLRELQKRVPVRSPEDGRQRSKPRAGRSGKPREM